MRYALLALLLFTMSCTSSHRIVAVYESGDAVSAPLTVLDKKPVPTVVKESKDEEAEESSGNLFSDMLP